MLRAPTMAMTLTLALTLTMNNNLTRMVHVAALIYGGPSPPLSAVEQKRLQMPCERRR